MPTLGIADYVKIVRDAIILAALGFVVWWIYHAGKNDDLVADMKAVQTQVESNSKLVAQWAKEAQDAETKRSQDTATIQAAIAAHGTSPVFLCPNKGSSSPVPSNPTEASGSSTGTGGSDQGSGRDLRPAITAFETKYETALEECRTALAKWPH